MFGKFTYLILDLFTIFPVMVLSFDKWVKFYKKWLLAIIATIPVGVLFIVWDIQFVNWNVWHFNNEYVVGLYFLDLPLEEWFFFVVVPIVCMFIYESITYHFKALHHKVDMRFLYFLIVAFCLLMLILFRGYYTTINATVALLSSAIMLVFLPKKELNLFAWMYLIHLIPFSLVNGVLTSQPVVIYNNTENMGIRFFTIPIEDFFYSFSLLALSFTFYIKLKGKIQSKTA